MKAKKGFTLIELIVVMAVFLFIIGAAIGIFLSIITNQKRVLSEEQLLNQVSYVQEYMSKAIRMAKTETNENCLKDSQGDDHPGYIYLLTRPENGIFRGIKFLNQSNNDVNGNPACQEFYLDTSVTPYVLKELKNSVNDNDAVALTSPGSLQFDLANPLKFAINGSTTGCGGIEPCGASNNNPENNSVQPRVTMIFNVIAQGDSQSGKSCIDSTRCSANQACLLGRCVPVRTIQTTISRRNLNVLSAQ